MEKNKNQNETKRIGWGVKIPYLSFEEVVKTIIEIAVSGGFEGSIDVIGDITKNSVSSSSFTKKTYALKNFGLLSNLDKVSYTISDLGRAIAQPESPEQEIRAKQEAFIKLETIKAIFENYKGKLLPQEEYLANYIEKNLNIPSAFKTEWAKYFIEGAKFTQLITTRESGAYQVVSNLGYVKQLNGIKKEDETIPRHPKGGDVEEQKPSKPQDYRKNIVETLFEGLQGGLVYQKKISNNRKALIFIPEDLTQSDIDSIKAIIKSVEAGLDGLKIEE